MILNGQYHGAYCQTLRVLTKFASVLSGALQLSNVLCLPGNSA